MAQDRNTSKKSKASTRKARTAQPVPKSFKSGGFDGGGFDGGGFDGGGFSIARLDSGGFDGGGFSGGGWSGGNLFTPVQSGLKAPAERPGRRFVSMGWHPDIPDFRDLSPRSEEIQTGLKKINSSILKSMSLPPGIDNRQFCSPVEDQGRLGSCTAQAVVGLMEYMMRKGEVDHIDGSRLFVYKVARKLLGWDGDTGAYLRTAMHAVSAFGVPPEAHYPYDIEKFEDEPSSFLYSYADRFKALNYTRLDPVSVPPSDVLEMLQRVLAAGYGIVFGFTVYSSLSGFANIPTPSRNDSMQGGHAVMAVGYNDNHVIEEEGHPQQGQSVPSLIIRNSWGTSWGEGGYGYLPYTYVLAGLAQDYWTSFKWDWMDEGQFG